MADSERGFGIGEEILEWNECCFFGNIFPCFVGTGLRPSDVRDWINGLTVCNRADQQIVLRYKRFVPSSCFPATSLLSISFNFAQQPGADVAYDLYLLRCTQRPQLTQCKQAAASIGRRCLEQRMVWSWLCKRQCIITAQQPAINKRRSARSERKPKWPFAILWPKPG